MLIAFDPVALNIGPLAVRWFGLLALTGLGLAVWLGVRTLERHGLPRAAALDALAWGLPVGLLSARFVHVLGWWDYYLAHGSELWTLNINVDGLSLWGGLVGGGLVYFARLGSTLGGRQRRRVLDAVAPGVGLGIALGRLGAFLDGHGQGVPSDLPWATQYANRLAATPDVGVPRQPVQLYDAVVALGVWAVVSRLPRHWPSGSRAAVFLVLYGAARLLLAAVRLDPPFVFGLQIEQILALGGVVFGLTYGLRSLLDALAKHASAEDASAQEASRGADERVHADRPHEDARPEGLPVAPLQVTLYMKRACHLCEAALSGLEKLQTRYPHLLEVVEIDADADLVRRYWDRIPVLHVNGREYDAPLTPSVLERALHDGTALAANPAAPTQNAADPARAQHHGTQRTTSDRTTPRAAPAPPPEADQPHTAARLAELR